MAKKKRRGKRRVGKVGVRRGEKVPHRKDTAGKKPRLRVATKGSGVLKKIGSLVVPKTANIWDVQQTLRRQKFFARVVGPNVIATNAPVAGTPLANRPQR